MSTRQGLHRTLMFWVANLVVAAAAHETCTSRRAQSGSFLQVINHKAEDNQPQVGACKTEESEVKPKQVPFGYWSWPYTGIYQILIDRFASPEEGSCKDVTDYCGGTLSAALEKLNYVKELGVDGVLLSPTAENMPGGYHGYWPKDLKKVDPHFGTSDDLKQFVYGAHLRGMKVVADLLLNHAGKPLNSTSVQNYSLFNPLNDSKYYHFPACKLLVAADFEDGQHDLESCSLFGMPDYKHEDEFVWKTLNDFVREHVDEFGFDAIRIDAARHIPHKFLDRLPEEGAPVPAFYEVPYGRVSEVSQWNRQEHSALYNYPLYFAMRDIFTEGEKRTASSMQALSMYLTQEYEHAPLNFLDNNDVPRFISLLGTDKEKSAVLYGNAQAFLMMAPGVPMLLFGSEQSVRGAGQGPFTTTDSWRAPLWETGYNTEGQAFQTIKTLMWLRKRYKGFHNTTTEPLLSDESVIAFLRGDVLVAITNQASPQSRVLWSNYTLGCKIKRLCNLLNPQECKTFAPGQPTQLDFDRGPPKVFVSEIILEEFRKDNLVTAQPKQILLQQNNANQSMILLDIRRGDLNAIPDPPNTTVISVPRYRVARRNIGVPQPYVDEFQEPVATSDILRQDDEWYPPLSVITSNEMFVSLRDGCVGTGENEFVTVHRGQNVSGLCSRDWDCNVSNWKDTVFDSKLEFRERPLLHLFHDIWLGFYHRLVEGLELAPHYLKAIKAGKLDVYVHRKTPKPIFALLKRMGVPDNQIFSGNPANTMICAHELIFTYPRGTTISAQDLQQLQKDLNLPVKREKDTGDIVFLSRGNDSRTVSNEPEVVQALKDLGRKVIVHYASENNTEETIEVVSQADMIVGPHGANLANMIYAPRDVKVIEILPVVPYSMVNYHFRILCGALGFSYGQVSQEVLNYNKTLAVTNPDKAVASFYVDPGQVQNVAKALFGQ